MSDFSDRPFVAGSLFGLRSFDMDRLGRLTSLNHPRTVFTPGENEATCLADDYNMPLFGTLPGPHGSMPKPEVPPHDVGSTQCTCGFYAYCDGTNRLFSYNRPEAIIQGYGVCSVGDLGFRASKARLVALVTPDLGEPEVRTLWKRVEHNYPGVPVYTKRKAALAKHPLTIPKTPTPETCDDFWTRPVR